MTWLTTLYVIGAVVWAWAVIVFCDKNPIHLFWAGLLGIVWPISSLAVLIYIYSERTNNND